MRTQPVVSQMGMKQAAPDSLAICTIVSKNYLAQARTLAHSLRAQYTSLPVFVLLVDRVDGAFDPGQEPFELIELEALGNIPNLPHLIFKYDVIELNTAVKAHFLQYLFDKGFQKVIYFDPDILVMSSLERIVRLLDQYSIVLTPHIEKPYEDDHHPTEIDINLAGVFNLGFIALADTEITRKFLNWWASRLYNFCAMAPDKGMHVDQNWVNFAPVMYEGVFILRDPAYNIAYWNLHGRYPFIQHKNGAWWIDNQPVVFFHFSGFEPHNLEKVSKHQNRFVLSDLPGLRPLFQQYAQLLIKNGYHETRQWSYAFNSFSNGVRIPRPARKHYFEMSAKALEFGDPFDAEASDSYFKWLTSPVYRRDGLPAHGLTQLMLLIYQSRPDLQASFPHLLDQDRIRFLEWFKTSGQADYRLDSAFLPTSATIRASERPWGVNVSGYIKGEFGVAEEARSAARALDAIGVPYVLNNVASPFHRNLDPSYSDFTRENPHPINLIHVNADQAPAFEADMGRDYLEDHYNICFWAWELERFPDKWMDSFANYQEIWVRSNFILNSIAQVSPIPVLRINHALDMTWASARPNRDLFSLSPDVFTYLFSFDFLSVFERKNPLVCIEAFRRAFGKSRDALLLLKCINSKYAPDKLAQVQEAIKDLNVRLIDGHLSRDDMRSLMATADCFVSLHRAEGCGLGIAQAMLLGKPVVVTAYSGNMDFNTVNNSFLVEYDLVELDKDYGPYEKGNVWAGPRVEHAAEQMRLVFDNRELAARKGQQAVTDICRMMSPENVGAEMLARFKVIASERYYNKANDPINRVIRPKATGVLQRAAEAAWQVDIVIPIYGQAQLTKRCVESVLATTEAAHLILVDDDSPHDNIETLFSELADQPRITLARAEENQGFIGATRYGASLGQAPYILFLNSDIEVHQAGWLDALFPKEEKTAIVGAQLLFPPDMPDLLAGRVQHAGVARKPDGTPYHPYHGWLTDEPAVNIPRSVNAVTGACLLIRRSVWDELGGWDDRFGRGVYEDVDLCWQARQKGYDVRYEPAARLYHRESASQFGGEHLLYQHQKENLKKLLAKWPKLQSDEAIFFDTKAVRGWQQARQSLVQARTALDKGDGLAAQRLIQQALKDAPDLSETLIAYAEMNSSLGDHKTALDAYQKALHYAPILWPVRLQLIDEHLELKQFVEAKKALSDLASVFPLDEAIRQRKARLAGLLMQALLPEANNSRTMAAYRGLLDIEFVDFVRATSQTALKNGKADLAAALREFADKVEAVLFGKDLPVVSVNTFQVAPEQKKSRPAEIFDRIVASDDILSALQESAPDFDAELVAYVKAKAQAAREGGEDELAEGLDELAAIIAEQVGA